jgi:hypothetical protein
VELLAAIRQCRSSAGIKASDLPAQSAEVTDANAGLFDLNHQFAGCIAGLHEILCRQHLMAVRRRLDPYEDLSPGQLQEIDRICAAYPHLNDDEFIAEHLDCCLRA